MQRGVAVVLGEALVLVALTRELDGGVLRQGHADWLPVQLLLVQVAHG